MACNLGTGLDFQPQALFSTMSVKYFQGEKMCTPHHRSLEGRLGGAARRESGPSGDPWGAEGRTTSQRRVRDEGIRNEWDGKKMWQMRKGRKKTFPPKKKTQYTWHTRKSWGKNKPGDSSRSWTQGKVPLTTMLFPNHNFTANIISF